MAKNYKIKNTYSLIKKLKPFWARFKKIEEEYYDKMHQIEIDMTKKTKIKDIELFFCDNECVGIGNYSRTMELVRKEDLEK